MVTQVEHLGLAVKALSEAEPLWEALLGTSVYKREGVEREGVMTAFLQAGETKIELLEATHPDSPIAKFLDKRGEGLHHIAFAVNDIHAEMARLKAAGFELLSEEPKPGADGKLVCFVHPKTAGGVLVELCMDNPNV
jgi:methylmalonyl-CoA/ethylmalonyl-CoA epimerase